MSTSFRQRAEAQGVVVSDSQEATGRRAFFQVDPDILESVDATALQDVMPSSVYVEFDPMDYVRYLPPLEAEILWMIRERRKLQPDIAQLLHMSQATISYRYRRIQLKLAYLVMLTSLDVRGIVAGLDFLQPFEQAILVDLFFYVHQEAVGRLHNRPQSSVKWVALKTKARLETLERQDPERWCNALGLIYLLFDNLGIRVRSA